MSSQEIANDLKDKLYSDGDVNYMQLNEGFEFVTETANTVLTVLAAFLVIGIQLIIALEIIYINFPIFSEKMDNIMEGGTRKSKFCNLTLRDARRAVKQSVLKETNPNLEYLKIKISTIFIMVFILAIAVGGGAWFIDLISRLLSGPLGMIRNALL